MELYSKNSNEKVNDELSRDASGKDKGNYQLKTTINFAAVRTNKKKTNWFLVIPGILIIGVAAAAFYQFGIVDRFNSVGRAEAEVASLQKQLEQDNELINASGELADNFYHNTWSDMTDEEKNRISRLEVAELIEEIDGADIKVNSYNVKDNLITVDVTTDTLANISKLSEVLSTTQSVESVSVSNASKENKDKSASQGEGAESTAAQEKVVKAQVKVYMKPLDKLLEEREQSLSAAKLP